MHFLENQHLEEGSEEGRDFQVDKMDSQISLPNLIGH